ncbi:hypothetical protein FOZG_00081 [Fusarium oxysporum Fo47]|uniref:Uncharacterized protein n=1 Tax=Fusarium oxysporum Fo47 TaxID=660027 RepID=W9KXA2_FUSOX|nr:hypothetical protein FOZG_00081 [Fusarium oxysporum Fo47]
MRDLSDRIAPGTPHASQCKIQLHKPKVNVQGSGLASVL